MNSAVVGKAFEGYGQEGILYSESSFSDFDFTADVKIQQTSHAGFYFRVAQNRPHPIGYRVQIIGSGVRDMRRTGSLDNKVVVRENVIEDDTWFTPHVTARRNQIKAEINGKTTADLTDEKYQSGHFAVQCRPVTEVSLRNPRARRLP